MRIADLALRSKIMFGAVPPLVLLVLLSIVSYFTLQSLLKAIVLVDQTHESVEQARKMENGALEMQSGIRGYLMTGDERFLKDYQHGEQSFNEALELLKSATKLASQLEVLGQCSGLIEEWKVKAAKPAIQIRETVAASELLSQLDAFLGMGLDREYFDKFREQTSKFVHEETTLLKDRKQDADLSAGAAVQILVIGTLAIALLSQVISYFIAGRVSKPVIMAANLAEATSKGDLTGNLRVAGNDEVGLLSGSLNTMVTGLRDYTEQVLKSIQVLSGSTLEISVIAQRLSSNASTTGSAITETTTTVEQVKQAAKVSIERAQAVAKGAMDAVEVSVAGRKATDDAVEGMRLIKEQMESIRETVVKLSERSQFMQEMIDTVQDIADQSNLLAVNASIEAARAGEHGKGFGVVAREIKDLADQSKNATKKIRGMLEETGNWINAVVNVTDKGTGMVDAGLTQSKVAGDSIRLLAKTVENSSQAASVIVASIEQQFAGVDQVSSAMTNIESAMDQNLSNTHELDLAVRRLESLSAALHELVQKYKV